MIAQQAKLYEINTQGLAAPSFSELELADLPFLDRPGVLLLALYL